VVNLIFISLVSNILMIGISLITHFVTYPSFMFIKSENFSKFHDTYSKIMLFIAGPIMTLEFFTTFFSAFYITSSLILISFFLVILIWILTFFIIVPIHKKIALKYNDQLNKKLIKFNGYRTLLWICKFGFMISIINI